MGNYPVTDYVNTVKTPKINISARQMAKVRTNDLQPFNRDYNRVGFVDYRIPAGVL